MKKYLANMISFSRIILASSLFWFYNNKRMFIIIYALCWFTDAIDGTVARLTNSQSELGSKIDDIADTTLIIIMGVIMIMWIQLDVLKFIPFVVALIIIRVVNMMITKYKYGKVQILHTYSAKALGLLVLIMPIVYIFTNKLWIIGVVLIFSLLVSLEESFIHITSDSFNPDKKSLFIKANSKTSSN